MIWRKQANPWRTITRPDVRPVLNKRTPSDHNPLAYRAVSSWSVDAIARVLVKTMRSFGAHVCFLPTVAQEQSFRNCRSGARSRAPKVYPNAGR